MTNEEFNKKMEFIVDQQAQLVVNQEKADERMTRLENAVMRLENVVGRFATASLEKFESIEEKIDALVDSQVRLTDAQARTDENMRNLITVVDRYLSEGRDGKIGS